MAADIELFKYTYDKYLNLKLAAQELGVKWQTLYWHLNKVGHPVIGNKEVYGSPTDKLARYTEKLFSSTIPYAVDLNDKKFQAKLDFSVKGYKVDVKASTKKDGYKNNPRKNAAFRWAFSCKVQEKESADFLVCYCYSGYDTENFDDVEKNIIDTERVFQKYAKYFGKLHKL